MLISSHIIAFDSVNDRKLTKTVSSTFNVRLYVAKKWWQKSQPRMAAAQVVKLGSSSVQAEIIPMMGESVLLGCPTTFPSVIFPLSNCSAILCMLNAIALVVLRKRIRGAVGIIILRIF